MFDFDEDFIIGEAPDNYLIEESFKNNILDYYQEKIDILESYLDTEIFFYGEGFYQNIFIKIFNTYIVFTDVLLDDDEDFDGGPDDPDDGEKIPDGDFLLFKIFYIKEKFFQRNIFSWWINKWFVFFSKNCIGFF